MTPFVHQGRVAVADTDLAGMVHHANYFCYMEVAEQAFWRAAGHSLLVDLDGKPHGWPKVHASCDYQSPLRFDDEWRDLMFVTRVGDKSVHYLHVMQRAADESVVALGRLVTVCMVLSPASPPRSVSIPPVLRGCLEVAPEDSYAQYLRQ